MLGAKEKSFFMSIALNAKTLLDCPNAQGAVVIRNQQILSYGINKKIITEGEWEISAVYDAVFGARGENLEGCTLFSTYFPSVDDLKLIVAVGITSINFVGEVKDPEAVKLMNELSKASIPLEIIKLE